MTKPERVFLAIAMFMLMAVAVGKLRMMSEERRAFDETVGRPDAVSVKAARDALRAELANQCIQLALKNKIDYMQLCAQWIYPR